jgi:hypothetical protein
MESKSVPSQRDARVGQPKYNKFFCILFSLTGYGFEENKIDFFLLRKIFFCIYKNFFCILFGLTG